jgi:hypothetical protein
MTDNQYELTEHCIDTEEFVTIKIFNRYLLCHRNVVNNQLDLGKSLTQDFSYRIC